MFPCCSHTSAICVCRSKTGCVRMLRERAYSGLISNARYYKVFETVPSENLYHALLFGLSASFKCCHHELLWERLSNINRSLESVSVRSPIITMHEQVEAHIRADSPSWSRSMSTFSQQLELKCCRRRVDHRATKTSDHRKY